jgi:hypothetical protein
VRPADLDSPEGRRGLQTADGRAWLESDDAVAWLVSGEGEDWLGSRDGREWTEAREDERWDEYISGKLPSTPLPDWALTPNSAPQVGTRVRFVEHDRTMGGVEFAEGELGIVTEARFTPMGAVFVTVGTLDGRKRITGIRGTLRKAT